MEPIVSLSTMDRGTRMSTLVILFLLFGVNFALIYTHNFYFLLSMFFFNILICGFSRGYMPDSFELDKERITVYSYLQKTEIPLCEIISVREMRKEDGQGMIRTFGISMLFGSVGYFHSPSLGNIRIFARRRNNWILITTRHHGNFVIAPDDSEFIHHIDSYLIWR